MPRTRVTEIETVRRHLLIWVPIGAVLIALVSALVARIPLYGGLEHTAREQVLDMGRDVGRSIEELLQRFVAVARQITARTVARAVLTEYNRGAIDLQTARLRSRRLLQDAVEMSPDVRGLVRLGADCEAVVSLGRPTPAIELPCSAEGGTVHGPVQLDGEFYLVITAPIRSEQGRRVGTDLLLFSMAELDALLRERAALGSVGEAWIAFGPGRGERLYGVAAGDTRVIILPPSAPPYELLRDARADLVFGYGSVGPTRDSILALVPIRGTADWQLLVRMNEDVVSAPLQRQLAVNMISVLLLSMAGGALLYLFMRPLAGGIVVKAKTLRDEVEARTRELRDVNDKLSELTDIQNAVLASADNIIVATDLRGRIFLFNPAAERLLGYGVEEVSGRMTPESFLDPAELERRARALSELYGVTVSPGLDVLTLPLRKQQRERYEWTYVCKDGRRVPVLIGGSVLQNPNRETYGYVFVATDISELKRVREELEEMARTDVLTGVSNRRFLEEEAEHIFASSRRHRHSMAALILDLDHFKAVNDTFGHDIGDRALKEVAAACVAELRTEDIFGRFGGEEFLAVLPETGVDEARHAAERVRAAIGALRLQVEDRELRLTVSIGGAILRPEDEEFAALLRRADAALYEAKERGRDRTVISQAETGKRP